MHKIENYLFKDNSIEAKRERIKCDLFDDGEEITISGSSNGLDGTYIVEGSNKEKSISLFCEKHKTFISEIFRKSIFQCKHEIEGETLIVKVPYQALKEIIEEKSNEKDLRLLEDYFGCFYSQFVVEEIKWPKKLAHKIPFGEKGNEETYKALYEQKPTPQELEQPKKYVKESAGAGVYIDESSPVTPQNWVSVGCRVENERVYITDELDKDEEPAKGERLDYLGELVGISKKRGETETGYRERILSKLIDIDEASEIPKFEGKIQGFNDKTMERVSF
jgi:hypothetical protein